MTPTRNDNDATRVMIGVMSDTHGNRALMFQVLEVMKHLGATVFFHLGDDYPDAEELAMTGLDVRMVPGLWCDAYHNARVPKRIVEDIHGVTIAAAHAAKDLRHTEHGADIIMTGHTHEPAIERVGHALYLNPGHLKGPESRGNRPSFGMLTLSDQVIDAAIHELTGEIRFEKRFDRPSARG